MDILPDIETLQVWLMHYGSFTLFFLLALGIVALPIPEETLMILSGALMGGGILNIHATIFAAFAGSVTGITMSYFLGRTAGIYFIHKYGKWLGIKATHIEKVHYWFEHYGKWSLFIGYFIPGVRHFTGFIAGTSALEYKQFALFAYTGALFWVSTFLSLGYFFGNFCAESCKKIVFSDDIFFIIAAIAIAVSIIYVLKKQYEKTNNSQKDR